MSPSRSVAVPVALAGVVAVTAASCGARTPLDGVAFDASVIPAPTSDAGEAHPLSCVPGTLTLTRAIPTLMFIIDRSGSMGGGLSTGNAGPSRWSILTNALAQTLPPIDDAMQIGALLFPSSGAGRGGAMTCTVAGTANLTPATGNVTPLLDLLRGTTPGGSTPTANALDVAAPLLLGVRAAKAARAMVLATDGAPNCNASLDPSTCVCGDANQSCRGRATQCLDDVRTIAQITEYESQGLPTYVIGIQNAGDTVYTSVLNRMAEAGGRALVGAPEEYYPATSAAELNTALVTIRDQVGLCTYLTTSVPDQGGTITVSIGGATVPFDPSGQDGWKWGDESNGEIILVGAACKAASGATSPSPSAQIECGGSDAGDGSGDSATDAALLDEN